jgi:adenine-specific DNA-methyltransferase
VGSAERLIKYLGSKRRLVPILGAIVESVGARSALDLFTGTTRVAQAMKARGARVTAVDTARYSEIFARCYIETDAGAVSPDDLADAIDELNAVRPVDGYVTETFCRRSRFFQPFNGQRIDAIRDRIERDHRQSPLYPLLLTSLIESADRVDSTTGVQMAYVKQWAPRSFTPLQLRVPELLAGPGTAVRGDACQLAEELGPFDIAYLDPPYNQHRYFTNYHVWETLVAWDAPQHYGVACKRLDAREEHTKSRFNSKRAMPDALRAVVRAVRCELLVLSYNDESWLTVDELTDMVSHHEAVTTLSFDSARYVGSRIGIHNPAGEKVGRVSHVRNTEYLVLAGSAQAVDRAATAAGSAGVDPLDGASHRPSVPK